VNDVALRPGTATDRLEHAEGYHTMAHASK
jgi:hypothetical protein